MKNADVKYIQNGILAQDRRLSNRRIYPAIDVTLSGTRKEELLLDEKELNRVWILRRLLNQMPALDAMEFLKGKMAGTRNNEAFLDSMNRQL